MVSRALFPESLAILGFFAHFGLASGNLNMPTSNLRNLETIKPENLET